MLLGLGGSVFFVRGFRFLGRWGRFFGDVGDGGGKDRFVLFFYVVCLFRSRLV